jgi:hypothetical protein
MALNFACCIKLEPAVIPPIISPIINKTIDSSTKVKPVFIFQA